MWKHFCKTMTLNPFLTKTRTMVSPMSVIGKAKDMYPKSPKPPNILLFSPGQDQKIVPAVLQSFEKCLASDRYILYPMNYSSFCKDPWLENTEMIIIWASKEFLTNSGSWKQISTKAQEYLAMGGKVLNFCRPLVNDVNISVVKVSNADQVVVQGTESMKCVSSSLGWSGEEITGHQSIGYKSATTLEYDGKEYTVAIAKGKEIMCALSLLEQLKESGGNNTAILQLISQYLILLNIECGIETKHLETKTALLPCNVAVLFTLSKEIKSKFLSWFDRNTESLHYCAEGLRLIPNEDYKPTQTGVNEEEVIAVYSDAHSTSSPQAVKHQFDFKCYQQNLETNTYGHIVVYADIIGTTMTVFDGLAMRFSGPIGLVAIARQQTKGQGRCGNKWLSPVGCAMFTLTVSIPINSRLGRALPILQHMTAVAVAQSITSLPGLENVNIGVKWPNDIYFGKHIKLGGIVVKSTIVKDICIASIGCGVNISNEKPTVCVNQLLKEQYGFTKTLKCEQVIARTLTQLESIVNEFQKNGPEKFFASYYKYWIHNGSYVKVQRERQSEEKFNALVVGIDHCGYIRVRLDDGSVTTLSPDGNSFDLTKNLIISKT